MKKRMDAAEERLYSDVVKSPPRSYTSTPKATKVTQDKSDVEKAIEAAKLKIGLKPVNIEDLDRIANAKKVSGEACLTFAAIEFLSDELKMDSAEIDSLGPFTVTRKDDDRNN